MQDAVQGRVLVMGDSISDDGRYIAMINAYLKFCGFERLYKIWKISEKKQGQDNRSRMPIIWWKCWTESV